MKFGQAISRRVWILTVVAMMAIAGAATGAPSSRHFSAQEFLDPIKYLSSDQLKGRGDGTPQLDQAADYLAEHLGKFGLKPAGDNGTFLQHFSLLVGAKLGTRNAVRF